MTWSMIIGNGFTLDAVDSLGIKTSPSFPWDWPIMNPYQSGQPFLEVLPKLNAHLGDQGSLSKLDVSTAMETIVQETQSRPAFPPHQNPTDYDFIHMEASHYLRLAYAWFSNQFITKNLNQWRWTKWFLQNGSRVETILSYNYDLVLEKVMRLASLGKVYGKSFKYNPIYLNDEPYIDSEIGDKKVIHIAKPHGSSNFTSWLTKLTRVPGLEIPLYPISPPFVLRASPLKVLEEGEIRDPVSTADIILPGEWTWWNKNISTEVDWSGGQTSIFIEESMECQRLLVVGFSYGEPDRPEFDEILSRLPKFQEVHIVHPYSNPPKELANVLKKISTNNSVHIGSDPP